MEGDRPISHTSRVLDLRPQTGEMIKPRELIELRGATALTLTARRIYNVLVAAAWGLDLGRPGAEFEVPLAELRGSHDSNDRLEDAIEALMRTIVVVRLEDGTTRRVALLGGNDLKDGARRPGVLRYSFDHRLAPILRDSKLFGILEIQVMHALSSKHGLALYEALCRRVRLTSVFCEEVDLDAFREMLGVEAGKLARFADLRRYAIEPAVGEICALAPFSCRVEPVKQGRRVAAVRLSWWHKSRDDYRAALRELQRPRDGRRARIAGTAETVAEANLLTAEERADG